MPPISIPTSPQSSSQATIPAAAPERVLTKSQLTERLGNSGTSYFSGFFSEDYNAGWNDSRRIDIVEEMRRSDGAVAAILEAMKTPLLATHWYVQSASDDPRDKDIAAEVEQQLFHMEERGFLEFLREALAYLEFGHYVFEKIWIIRADGRIAIKDLAPRIPKSILRWETNNGQRGITQFMRNDQKYEGDNKYNTELTIPWEKLLVLTHHKEGDDYTGIPIVRPAYSHWYHKKTLYEIQSIAMERMGAGMPTAKYDQNVSQAAKDKMELLLKNMYANQTAYLMYPEGIEFEFKTPGSTGLASAISESILHHNRMIMLSVLAEFLDLGSGDTGSFALSQDQSSFFLQHLENIARYLCEQISRNVIKQIVDLNFGPQQKYPQLAFAPLGSIDYQEMAGVLSTLSGAELLNKDPQLMQFIRKLFRLPELSAEQMEKMEADAIEAEMATIESDADFNLPMEEPMIDEEAPIEGEEDEQPGEGDEEEVTEGEN